MHVQSMQDQFTGDTAGLVPHLLMRVGNTRLAVPTQDTRAVLPVQSRLTPLPHAPPHLLGLGHWSGLPLPVVDLLLALGLEASPDALDARLVVVEKGDFLVGLQVSQVMGLHFLAEADVQPCRLVAAPALVAVCKGETGVAGGPVAVVDVALLLDSARPRG